MSVEAKALAFLKGGVAIQDFFDTLQPSEVSKAEMFFASISVNAGVCAKYLMYRGGAGCGDHGHEEAAKQAARQRKQLRKANGYSIP